MSKVNLNILVAVCVLIMALAVPALGRTIYVDSCATGANNGTSWDDAMNFLQDALAAAVSGDQIWVAEGTYRPDQGAGKTPGDRAATFHLKNGVTLYGGFAGSASLSPNERDVIDYETTLSGDLNEDDVLFYNNSENTYHVVTASGTNNTAVLDSFTVSGGNADGSSGDIACGGAIYNSAGSPTVKNCTFFVNYARSGGAIYNTNGSPMVTNCTFILNYADSGAGMYNNTTTTTVTNCIFALNTAFDDGGGIYNGPSSTLKVTNSLFSGNTGAHTGGGLYNASGATTTVTNCTLVLNLANAGGGVACDGAVLKLRNSILWQNSAVDKPQIYDCNATSDISVSYSDVQGSWTGTGTGNIDEDPCFVYYTAYAPTSVFRLSPGSPCIDAGNNDDLPVDTTDLDGDGDTTEQIPYDLDGSLRVVDGDKDGNSVVDMGAYERRIFIYVDDDASGANTGSNWKDAYNYLQDALAVADYGCTIRVAHGTYKPDQGWDPEPDDRTATFQLKDGVRIIGGYVGNTDSSTCCIQTDPGKQYIDRNCCCECQPDPSGAQCGSCPQQCTGKTILSGDIGDTGSVYDNSYHVVTGSGTDANTVLENVTITGGNADGNYPNNNGGGMLNDNGNCTVRYCCFVANNAVDAGGGMYNFQSSPTLTGNSFCNNTAKWGAGLANYTCSSPNVTNCVFRNNTANQTGGAINNTVISDPQIVNCTFYENSAGVYGGAIYSNGSDPYIYNSILWENSASTGAQIALVANNRRTRIGYCDLQGDKGAVHMENATVVWNGPIMNVDPNFVDPNGCNLRLRTNSPCLDASNNDLISGNVTEDRDGKPRFIKIPAATVPPGFGVGTPPIADLGAYERAHVIYVKGDAGGAKSGINWQNAYVFLQDALADANYGDQIWVAEGQYTPDRFTAYPNLRYHPEQTFNLKNGVALYGGFDGTETDIFYRDCNTRNNETVLSGDLFGNDNYATPFDSNFFENSWNILTCDYSLIDANDILDCFTIKGGYANGTPDPTGHWNDGGGMHNSGSPIIKRCLFQYNWAYDDGGGMYNMYGSPTLTDCEFKDNFARQGGAGLYNGYGQKLTLIRCDFKMNNGAKHGGGIYNEWCSDVTLVKCSFSQNGSAYENGGGMYSKSSNLHLCDCNFVENEADQDGGAMYNKECKVLELFQCRLEKNTAGDDGGAIYNFDCTDMNLVNCAFLGNKAIGWGGAIHNDNFWPLNSYGLTSELINCTFTKNEAEEGGAIYNAGDFYYWYWPGVEVLTISNSILWQDIADYGPEISIESTNLLINDSIIEGGEPNIFVWGDVSISVNNLYVKNPLIKDDGRLVDPNSPARDAGNNSYLPACVTTDLDGNPRIHNNIVDLGAYEFGYTSSADFDNDGIVGLYDLAILGSVWMTELGDAGWDPNFDVSIPADNVIDWFDLKILCENWLANL